jgi:hypothetical protein
MQEAASHDHQEVVMLLISSGGAIWEGDKVGNDYAPGT